jgi:hypothetical protein
MAMAKKEKREPDGMPVAGAPCSHCTDILIPWRGGVTLCPHCDWTHAGKAGPPPILEGA